MIIKILSENVDLDSESRYVKIIISDGAIHYHLGVSGLPLAGNLQPILEASEAKLWQVAEIKDDQLTTEQVRRDCYNSPSAGGWTNDEFQEAFNENFGGRIDKLRRIKDRRDAIRAEWPF